jgi:phosphoribosylanthranilate isomerase
MRIYITGIRTMKDVQLAVTMGASAVGIKMGYGKDDVHPETARDIFFSLPVFISRVGIFHNEPRYQIQELVTFCRLDTLHFTGEERPEDLNRYPEHVLKTFDRKSITKIQDYPLQGAIVKLDKGSLDDMGLEKFKIPTLILCGDLTITEWETVINRYRPYAIQWDLSHSDRGILERLLDMK